MPIMATLLAEKIKNPASHNSWQVRTVLYSEAEIKEEISLPLSSQDLANNLVVFLEGIFAKIYPEARVIPGTTKEGGLTFNFVLAEEPAHA